MISQSKIDLMVSMIIGLINARNVTLKEVALSIQGEASLDSKVRRIERFLGSEPLSREALAKFIVDIMHLSNKTLNFVIDRTNWEYGNNFHNILFIGIVYDNVAIPILWDLLDKEGNSNFEDRKKLIDKLVRIFGQDRIESISGDREFIGDEWMNYLDNLDTRFYLRLKENHTIQPCISEKELVTANKVIKDLKKNQGLVLPGRRQIGAQKNSPHVEIAALRNEDNELVIIATNGSGQDALEQYKKRWTIETMFGCLKTRGFNLENTHITKHGRFNMLLSLVVMAFAISYASGVLSNELNPIKIKKSLNRKSVSVFKYGLDVLRSMSFNIRSKLREMSVLLGAILNPLLNRCRYFYIWRDNLMSS
jgi:hypothetical protein